MLKQIKRKRARKTPLLPLITVALLAVVWSGCEKDYNYVTPAVVIDTTVVLSFKNDIQPIFSSTGCYVSGCHDGSESLDLTPANAYSSLFSRKDIDTTNATISKLYVRITLPSSDPKFMPTGGSPLSATETANILAWIKQGAKNN